MERKELKFNVSNMDEDKYIFSGYAAVKGNIDSYGDILQHGSMKRTLRNTKTFPLLWFHKVDQPAGLITYAKEDDKGLYIEAKIDSNTELGRMMFSGIKNGYIDRMSIGYVSIRDRMDKKKRRLLDEIKIMEISLVTKGFAANDQALVSSWKTRGVEEEIMDTKIIDLLEEIKDQQEVLRFELNEIKQSMADSPLGTRPSPPDPSADTLEEKAVIGASGLPIASRDREWDGPAAKRRIFEWAGGEDFSPEKAKRAFFFVDGDPKNRGSYKLPFADVIDGKLMAVPRALIAVEGSLNGARGGVDGVSESDKSAIMSKVNAYKKRMGMDDEKTIDAIIEFKKFLEGVNNQ